MLNEITPEKILELRTPAGGWTKETLEKLGIPWPPPSGWKAFLERVSGIKPVYGKSRYPKFLKGPNGEKLCRGCSMPVPAGRQTWCSSRCYQRFEPGNVKMATHRRDKGICQLCGVNVAKQIKDHWKLKPDIYAAGLSAYSEWQRGFPKIEYDHIIPFSEGGPTVIENMRSLCVPCHKKRTKEWRKARKSFCSLTPSKQSIGGKRNKATEHEHHRAGYAGREVKVAGLERVLAIAVAALFFDCLLLIPAIGVWLMFQ